MQVRVVCMKVCVVFIHMCGVYVKIMCGVHVKIVCGVYVKNREWCVCHIRYQINV